jgi:UDP-N-acetyl-2-amino-2-deoxyglucuronate dehydrogenase
LGLGTIGSGIYEHLLKRDDIQVVRILELLRHPGLEHLETSDYNEILNDPEIDTVIELIGGMEPAHTFTVQALKAGKNVITEKPMATTLEDARAMVQAARESTGRLGVIFQNRYNPLVKMMKDLIDAGKFGKIHQFSCNVFWNRNDEYFAIDWHGTPEFDGGVLYTQASHYVDMLHYFFGEVESYKGMGSNMRGFDVYDSVSSVLRFKSGAVGTLNATVSVYQTNYLTEFTLICEKGTVRLSGTNLNQIDFWNVEGMEKPDMDFKIDHQYGKGHNTMYEYIAQDKFNMFPSKADVLSGIRLMEMLSY